MVVKLITIAILTTCVSKFCTSQSLERFNSFSYNVNEGLLQSTIIDMSFDKNNFGWISFPKGIQKFDGKNFINVPIQNGLPDDKQVQFFKCTNGDLLISHSQGISKYDVVTDNIVVVYLYTSTMSQPAQFIGEDAGIVYFYNNGFITGFNTQNFRTTTMSKTGIHQSLGIPVKFSDNIISGHVGIHTNSRLYIWNLNQGIIVDSSEVLHQSSYFFLRLKSRSEAYYFTYTTHNALYLYNFEKNVSSPVYINGKDNRPIGRCNIYPWNTEVLVSFNNQIFKTDSSLRVLQTEMVNYQNQPLSHNSIIAKIKEDNFGNIYLITGQAGIRKIFTRNYGVKYYGTEKKEGNFITSLLPDKKENKILAGATGNGLMVFDTLQRLVKHIKKLPNQSAPFTPAAIIKNSQNDYVLFTLEDTRPWLIKNNFSSMKPIPMHNKAPQDIIGFNYFNNVLYTGNTHAIVQSQGNIYTVSLEKNIVTGYFLNSSYVLSGLMYKGWILIHADDFLIFFDAVSFKELNRIPFLNTGGVRCFTRDKQGQIYIGSNNGIFVINEKGELLQHYTKVTGLPDDCIYAMVFDDEGQLWCSSNKGIFILSGDNSISQLTKDDGLQENEFNTNIVAKALDGELFFGGVNGISSFYPSTISNFEEKPQVLFTNIKINNGNGVSDRAIWNINKIDLAHHQNSLAFDFIAMGSRNPDQYVYQYRMIGAEDQWIRNNNLQTVRYFLPPGEYRLQIYASRFFDKDATPSKEILIIINPPFWNTWWFILMVVGIGTTGLILLINHRNKLRYQKKLAEIEKEHGLQLEREKISRNLHDSIGAYANAVLYHTELLEKNGSKSGSENLMNDLKFASKDIITSLRETVWALKKETFTAEDCLLRIRNFIQALSRYYPHIHFAVEGKVPEQKTLHHSQALNVVRMAQEIVTNSIKHSTASKIHLKNSEKDARWVITFEDNGKGFDEAAIISDSKGDGLNNLRKRATESGFELAIKAEPRKGTTINIVV